MKKNKIPQIKDELLLEMGKSQLIQQRQILDIKSEFQTIESYMSTLENKQQKIQMEGENLTTELEDILSTLNQKKINSDIISEIEQAFYTYEKNKDNSKETKYDIERVHNIITHDDWGEYYKNLSSYGNNIGIDNTIDPFLSVLSSSEYIKLDNEINGEFERRTSIHNKLDIKFLSIAIALEVMKGLLFPLFSEKKDYGKNFDSKDRLKHNDKSIKKEESEAINKYIVKKDKEKGKWVAFLQRPVPYDITRGSASLDGINLHGKFHRLYTLGHDPILGWVFGTANILTDVITFSSSAISSDSTKERNLDLMKLVQIQSYRVQREPMMITPHKITLFKMFRESYEIICEDSLNLPTAIFVEGLHLKSDVNTKIGLPVPVIGEFNPDFASKLYSNNYDFLCLARDMKVIGESAIISILIDTIIGLIHGLYYNPTEDGSRDLYEVRTRKILLIANTVGTSSNIITTCIKGKIQSLDLGGLFITLSHLFTDSRFILNVKKEFIENRIYEKIEREIEQLNNIEKELSEYAYRHQNLYK